ncbi:MAG: GntP family permease [Pirellulales bacterium]|nr:GntP family permease [Pirellulales bacterium]
MWPLALLVVCVVFIVVASTRLKLHPFLALLLAALGYGMAVGRMPLVDVVKAINDGFGATVGYIGLVILAGSVIGVFLEKSGGASSLAETTLRLVGRRNVPAAMALIGYLVSIPVFCDSAFVILAPLTRALSRGAGISLAPSAIALSLGLYTTHTMVPPTPGPVAAAGLLEADLGMVILWGLVVSGFAMAAGWLFAVKVAARVEIDPAGPEDRAEPAAEAWRPSPAKAVLPILLPIVLIVLKSIGDFPSHPFGQGRPADVIGFVGQPVVALLIGVFLALLLPRKLNRDMLSAAGWVGEAVVPAAMIIVVTGCGGAFGKVIQQSGIAEDVKGILGGANLGLWLPILLAAALKTAQGSSTVAMITTASIVAPLLPVLGLDAPAVRPLVAVAIGAGSIMVSHANDSFFWVVVQLSKMTVKQGYRLHTLGSLVIGSTAALATWLLSLLAA